MLVNTLHTKVNKMGKNWEKLDEHFKRLFDCISHGISGKTKPTTG